MNDDYLNDGMFEDDLPFPDINNEEPQSSCSPDDFDVQPTTVSVMIHHMFSEYIDIARFISAGGTIEERYAPTHNKHYFVAFRNKESVRGYGETPMNALKMWVMKTAQSED